jgi:predicted anti-sigma-YlaC factor YlaD
MDFSYQIPSIGKLIERLLVLDKTYGKGSLLSLAVNYYASVPEFLGGSAKLARECYDEALKTAGAGKVGLYVLAAKLFAVPQQDKKAFRQYLDQALAVKPEDYPDDALSVSLSLEQARWLKSHESDYFL